ncbi:hypothetical protein LXL04_034852 [Taraxacum kok-saghyz]
MVACVRIGGGDVFSARFAFSSQPVMSMSFLQPLFSNSSQRGPLQSSNAPSFRAWIDPPTPFTGVAINQHPTLAFHHLSSMSGLGGFFRFRIPSRIQGEEENTTTSPTSRPLHPPILAIDSLSSSIILSIR